MKKEEMQMTNRQSKALLKAIEIIVSLSKTKKQAKERIQEVAQELEKEPTDAEQSNR